MFLRILDLTCYTISIALVVFYHGQNPEKLLVPILAIIFATLAVLANEIQHIKDSLKETHVRT